ncbi:MAG: hypothetical protein K0Q72_4594 [Armatimonadetes bacterium]|jgi:hypothetical protein|nr:hypothetical protein [Armatimonadota bacterium]
MIEHREDAFVTLRRPEPSDCPESRSIRAAPTNDGDYNREAVPGWLRDSGQSCHAVVMNPIFREGGRRE